MIIASIFKWIARITALLLFIFWGLFFVHHLMEWFLKPENGLPPGWVWLNQWFHFMMLAGLILILKWDWLGAIITVLSTVAFFAGAGFGKFPFIALINGIPVIFLTVYWILKKNKTAPADLAR